jgi:NAD-dependent dihydropyrimidine dehydrogenase PreA subunit
MIKSIDEAACVNCGICENICSMDVFRRDNKEKVYIAYPGDCSTCMFCSRFCPANAIIVTPGIAKKYDVSQKWERVKEMMGIKPTAKTNEK